MHSEYDIKEETTFVGLHFTDDMERFGDSVLGKCFTVDEQGYIFDVTDHADENLPVFVKDNLVVMTGCYGSDDVRYDDPSFCGVVKEMKKLAEAMINFSK